VKRWWARWLKQRLEYTAIGDTINLGARLESITKDYKTNIIISESTYLLVKDQFVTKELGDVMVKGKSQPVKIYAVLPTTSASNPRATSSRRRAVDRGRGPHVACDHARHQRGRHVAQRCAGELGEGQTVQIRCEGGTLPKPIVAEALIAGARVTRSASPSRRSTPTRRRRSPIT